MYTEYFLKNNATYNSVVPVKFTAFFSIVCATISIGYNRVNAGSEIKGSNVAFWDQSRCNLHKNIVHKSWFFFSGPDCQKESTGPHVALTLGYNQSYKVLRIWGLWFNMFTTTVVIYGGKINNNINKKENKFHLYQFERFWKFF